MTETEAWWYRTEEVEKVFRSGWVKPIIRKEAEPLEPKPKIEKKLDWRKPVMWPH